MHLRIRPVRVEDAQAIVAILNPIIAAGVYTVLDTPFTVEEEGRYIAGFPPRGVLGSLKGSFREGPEFPFGALVVV